MKRKFGCFLLAVCLCVSLAVPSYAAEEGNSDRAEALRSLGLFLGSDNGFELDRIATRVESAVMVVRMLGREDAAKSENSPHPFSDVPDWASAYVGYLYKNNITKGISESLFGASYMATAAQYATYILRALGYDDSAGDFSWDKSLDKMASLGIITNAQAVEFAAGEGVLRGNVAAISYLSLFASPKDSGTKLLEKLYLNDKAVSFDQLKAAASRDERIALLAAVHGVPKDSPSTSILNSEEIFHSSSAAVFKINTRVASEVEFSSGSGFFISPDGLAVTNAHVLSLASSAEITMSDGKTYPIETVLGLNLYEDLALIKVKGSSFPYLELGDPSGLRMAQRIYCIGSPLGFDNTISDGLVSTLNREHGGNTYIQISAPIAPGSSGGALLNEYGQVVGVTTMGSDVGQVNLAVPITRLSSLFWFPEARTFTYLSAHSHFNCIPITDETYAEREPNNAGAVQSLANDTIMYGTISGSEDVDIYELEVDSASDVLVSLTSDSAHSMALKLEVADPSGKIIFKSAHYTGEIFSLAKGYAPAEGKYTVKIYVDGGNNWSGVGYELYWMAFPTYEVSEEYLVIFEFEPNDNFEHANYLPDFADILATSTSASDVDFYRFTLTQYSEYYARLYNGAYDYNAVVIDAATQLPVGTFTSNGSGQMTYSAYLKAGEYYIKVSPNDNSLEWNNIAYSLSGWFM